MNLSHLKKYSKLKAQLLKVFGITIAWTFIAIFQFLTIYAAITSLNLDVTNIDPMIAFKGSVLTGVLAGLLGGSLTVFIWEKWLRTEPYGWTILSIIVSYSVIYYTVHLSVGVYTYSNQFNLPAFSAKVWESIFSDFFKLMQLQNYLFWLMVVIGTLIYFLVNDKYGPGVFRAFLLGKYFHPKREERIFMFLDLRSSTEIAEKLGEKTYFNFLKDLYRDSTSSILLAKGEVYQYVGDEIVISWPTDKGVENANCINCFFDIRQNLRANSKYYMETYHIMPEFKAGLHYGNVMAGEIGVIKRDIVFSGDVLNTTSRIQNKCNDLGVDILFSKFLLNKLNLPANLYQTQNVGEIQLKGKESKLSLYTTL
ncbi:adenylate/guanylate cyclase domain-containing protein [Marinifilum caeruleilacunae]|uniref:Adenylate/guanylate cyclase domain-containing protein n=1 Tax=Marinifilum caeruleilacunae TaxID=2499076 RepID=A0ABX1WZF2_9BACT|nr:adenylate/guanylate cyclase domain-containing protein [Marinifilum caeruleilacunae]NOU61545.1 adenylate/guanylate cyclase domain-containing protein [Marinifilum caeruleilacunae]